MPPDALVDRIAALPIFESVPRSEIEWLVAHGELRTVEAGTDLVKLGFSTNEMAILLAGKLGLYVPRGGGVRKFLEAVPGQVLGTMPYSRFQRAPGTVVVEETATAFFL